MISIAGQQGKTFGPAQIDFAEIAASGSLTYQSLGVDELAFSIEPQYLDAREQEIPEEGQYIDLFQGSQRLFRGIVTRVQNEWGQGALSVDVIVSGAFWWLEQTALSDIVGVGNDAIERPQFRCEIGGVESHVRRLFDRMQDLGLPVALGAMDACYDIPTTTFQDASFGRALSELLRLVPDAVGWFDYSVIGNPQFRLSRRNTNAAEVFTLGSDAVLSGSLEAEYSLKIERVSIPYAERLLDGSISYKEFSAGTGSGTRQVVPVSGPELVDFVPPDPIDGVTISTANAMANSVTVQKTTIEKLFPVWYRFESTYPSIAATRNLNLWSTDATSQLYSGGVTPFIKLEDGTDLDINTHNRWAIIYDPDLEIPSWLSDVESVQKARLAGTVWIFEANATITDDWIVDLINDSDFVSRIVGGPNNNDTTIFFDLDLEIILLDRELTNQTFYKPLSYIFETPPADFAENLRAAQNWLPYIGSVNLEAENPPFVRKTGSTINLAGGRSVWESMGGLVQGETLDLFTREQSLSLGLPERLTGSTPVTRLERSSSDSLIIL
jgi:hypothetical protein